MKSAWFSGVPLLLMRTKTSATCSSLMSAASSSAVKGKLSRLWSLVMALLISLASRRRDLPRRCQPVQVLVHQLEQVGLRSQTTEMFGM